MADVPHTASLTVLVGPLKGRRHDFDLVVEEVLIGSDPDCQLCLDLPSVSPLHARVWLEVGGATVRDTHSYGGVFVNDDPVADQAPLRDGDFLWLGAPGGEGSVLLQFRGPTPQALEAAPSPAVVAEPTPAEEVWVIEEASEEATEETPAEPLAPAVATEPAAENPAEWFLEEAAPADPAPASSPVEALSPGPAEDTSGSQAFFFEEVAASQPVLDPTGSAFEEFLLEEGVETQPTSQEGPVFETPVEEASSLVQESEPAPSAGPEPLPLEWDEAALAAMDAAPLLPRRQAPPPVPPAAPPVAVPSLPSPPPPAVPPPSPAVLASPVAARVAIRPPVSTGTARPKRFPAPPSTQRKGGAGAGRLALLAVVPIAVLGSLGFAAWWLVLGAPHIEAADPREVRPGETVTLTGKNFATDPASNLVRFRGDQEGRVIQASPTRLQVEVPEVETTPGQEQRVPVVVSVSGRKSAPYELTLLTAPRIHGLSPSVAMPEEEITLVGGGWGSGVKVHFGTIEAQVVELKPTALRVRVPALPDPVGTQFSVVVRMGGVDSNPAPFAIGHLPLLFGVEPKQAVPGDLVVIRGRGFHLRASANLVKIGGAPALVLQASDSEIKAVVPRGAEGAEAPVEVRVPASPHLGQTTMALRGLPDPMGFQFVAEPFFDGSAHDHALLGTGLGPAFVLSASGGRSAGERALEAQDRLNAAAAVLRAGAAPDITVRLEGQPAVVLGGGTPLLEVSDEDAAAYNEEWTEARGKGGPATPARLALWWGALTRDLALALLRGERPRHAVGLAPEGRALAELFDAVRRGSKTGLTREAVARIKPQLREAARAAVLRVPASVLPPVAPPVPGGAQPAPSPPAKAEPLRLEGMWSGVEHEAGETRYVTVTFTRTGGSLTYERALSLTVPLLAADQPQKGTVRYSLRSATRTRHYLGKWNNRRIEGKICSDADCKTALGSFELERSR